MADPAPKPGTIAWHDLTVSDAEPVRRFYESVVGWKAQPQSMGDYEDFSMMAGEDCVAGVCHARGVNADVPPQWLAYVVVEDLERSMASADEHGGAVVTPARDVGGGRMAVVRDPAGAVLALWQPPAP